MNQHSHGVRPVVFMGDTQKTIDKWPQGVEELVKTNLQALQYSRVNSFSRLPDWINQGSVTDKQLSGKHLKGTHQLTVKSRNSYRVIYIAELGNKIFVLHAFLKKVEGADRDAMKTVESRLKRLKQDIQRGII